MTTASDILNSLESALMALDPPNVRLVQGASDFVAVKNWLHDKRTEIVRETILAALSLVDSDCINNLSESEISAAIAFVEAL